MVLHLLLIKGGMKTENGKVKSASKREQSNSFELPSDSRFEEVKTENYPPPPLRSSPLSQGDSWLG